MFKIDSGIVGFIEDFGLKGVAALRQETKLNKKAEYSIGYEEERQSPCVTSVIKYVKEIEAPKGVHLYYEKLVPLSYRWGLFNCLAPFKWAVSFVPGLFRPMPRGPYTKRGQQEVSIKSAALACENFVLALEAEGFSSCMMEGHDEWRVKRMLRLPFSARVVMVIAVGEPSEDALWGPQFRLPLDAVVHEV